MRPSGSVAVFVFDPSGPSDPHLLMETASEKHQKGVAAGCGDFWVGRLCHGSNCMLLFSVVQRRSALRTRPCKRSCLDRGRREKTPSGSGKWTK